MYTDQVFLRHLNPRLRPHLKRFAYIYYTPKQTGFRMLFYANQIVDYFHCKLRTLLFISSLATVTRSGGAGRRWPCRLCAAVMVFWLVEIWPPATQIAMEKASHLFRCLCVCVCVCHIACAFSSKHTPILCVKLHPAEAKTKQECLFYKVLHLLGKFLSLSHTHTHTLCTHR